MKHTKLAYKLGSAFAVILILMVSVNIFMLYKMSFLKKAVDEITDTRLHSVIAITEMNSETSNFRIAELQHSATTIPEEKEYYEERMTKTRERIKQLQQIYEPLVKSEEDSRLYTSFAKKWSEYLTEHEDFIELSKNNLNEEALMLINDKAYEIYKELTNDLQELVSNNKKGSFQSAEQAGIIYVSTRFAIILLLIGAVILSAFLTFFLVKALVVPIKQLESAAESVANGNINIHLDIKTKDEIGNLANSFNKMTASVRDARLENETSDWMKTGQNQLNEKLRGDQDIHTLSKNVITYLSKYLNASIGALYLFDADHQVLKLTGSYAFTKRKDINNLIPVGEGLVGQAAYEKELISITNIPADYIRINSALGDTPPHNLVVAPFLYENQLVGVIEFGTITEFNDKVIDFLKTTLENIAIAFNSAHSRDKINYLLKESQRKSEELQVQQEELKASNEELEAQTSALKISETKLKEQQEELQAANEELEEKTRYLEQQKAEITLKNIDLQRVRQDLETKAHQLEITSKYKSEFLANMSHELRTPLNSLLILARNLSENKSNNLTSDQIESAEIIHRSGNDLLELINDILDLSKIEAGKMPVNITNVSVSEIADNIQYTFKHMISEKGLQLIVKIDPDIPKSIRTDKQRIEQITKNIIANAVKFTQRGGITIEFHKPTPVINLSKSGLNHDKTIGISIADTGIGIPKDKQLAIFEAFQQADGSTSRKFGGTGLGLSISRELTKLLGGEMQLVSELNQGSTFTIYLPFDFEPKEAKNEPESKLSFIEQPVTIVDPFLKPQPIFDERIHATLPPSYVDDDRNSIQPDDRLILVIEDDMSFAKILLNQCHDKSFRCIAAQTGEDGLKLAEKYHPDAIILDIKLPGISGWAVLDTLKQNPNTMHIPIHMMSVEEAGIDAMHRGAVGFLTKPVKREDLESAFGNLENIIKKDIKDLLVVEDNQNLRKAIVQLISNNDVEITEASTGKEAIEALSNRQFDCMVLDLGLPDMTGYELLNQLHVDKAFKTPPVIIYTGKELTEDQERELNKYAESIIIKGAKSEERLLDETALFLHRVVRNMPHRMQQIIVNLHDKDRMFKDKKILLVDDDMRNVFAISKILTEKGIKVTKAEDGIKALKILEQDTDFDLILMDIMMPGLDGYETIQRIRQQNHLEKIPILALTAKAMKDDRDKCLAAGANDYLPKPVDIDRLFSMMRVWLYK